MKYAKQWRKTTLSFICGALSLVVVGLLLGAASDHQNKTLQFGRYQLSSWAAPMGENSGMVGAFVMDTVSGETRTVYIRSYGDPPAGKVLKNNLKKPFSDMY